MWILLVLCKLLIFLIQSVHQPIGQTGYFILLDMKSSLIIFILILINTVSECQQLKFAVTADIHKNTIIYDKLTRPAAILVWYDKYYDEHSIKPCGIYNQKKFGPTRELLIEEPVFFILPIGVQVPYLIYPGDTVIFYDNEKLVSTKAGNPTLRHKRLKQRTSELKFFEEVFDSLGACYGTHSYSIPGEIQTYKEVVNYQKNKLAGRISFLEKRYNQNLIGERFYQFAKTYFHYKFYDDVLVAFSTKKFFDTARKEEIMQAADSLVSELNDKESLNYGWYKSIMSYVELQLQGVNINDKNFDSCLNRTVANLRGAVKNFAAFYFYKYLINYRDAGFIGTKLEYLKLNCSDEDYVAYISGYTAFAKKNDKKTGNLILTDNLLNIDKEKRKLSDIISGYRGKVIYIDIWASWCIPCLEELPFSRKLSEHFRGEDVVFIFLSIDSYYTRWIDALRKNDMPEKSVHYLITDQKNNYFIKKYNIGPIPRYILINKSGEVVNADAPRPSEEKTKRLILELLK